MADPIHQFEIQKLAVLGHIGGQEIAFTNSALFMAIVVVGTWTIDDFLTQSKQANSPLAGGYTVVPFPPVFGKKAVFADGHSWVLLKGGAKDDKARKAALGLLRALWDNDFEWSRTGHLPARKSVVDSAAYKELPFRANIAEISSTAYSVPSDVPRQRAVETAVGEEVSSMYLAKKPIPDVQTAIEQRVGKLLAGAN